MRITANSAITSAPSQSASGIRQFGPLTWIALGTFATGTESFMIAALLPGLASDLSVTLTAAGQLVTVFSLTYAVSSPALSALTAGVGRRNLLLISMTAFALANFFASTATDFWQLFAARILLAAAAGLYVPSASALAGTIVAPERRGTGGRPRHRSDSDLGTGSVGLLSSTAIAADAARRIEDRADCAFAQCFVHVPGFLARRDARVARSHKCACDDTRPDWRGL